MAKDKLNSILDYIYRKEENNKTLISKQLDSCSLYGLVRFAIYKNLENKALQKINCPNESNDKNSSLSLGMINNYLSLTLNHFKNIFSINKTDYFIFQSDRYSKMTSGNPNTRRLCEELNLNKKLYKVFIQSVSFSKSKKSNNGKSFQTDFYYKILNYLVRILRSNNIYLIVNKSEFKLLKTYSYDIVSIFFNKNENKILIQEEISRTLFSGYFYYKIYKSLFKRSNLKAIFIEGAYYQTYLVDAAKKYQINTIELQHGSIYPKSIGYSLLGCEYANYPRTNIIALFSKYWRKNLSHYYKNNNQMIVVGSYLYKFRRLYNKQKNIERNGLLIISQGDHPELLEYAKNIARSNLSIEIYYKFHPQENIIKEKFANFNYVSGESSLLDLWSKCRYQVGVYSTALYEGYSIGRLITFVALLPGYMNSEDLYNSSSGYLVENSDEIISIIQKNKFENKFEEPYYEKDQMKKFVSQKLNYITN